MPILPHDDWDPQAPGSRFTLRPGFALLVGEVDEFELGDTSEVGMATELLAERIGPWILEDQEVLGAGRPVGGGVGRGATGWTPVVEWLIHPAIAGVVGALSWELTRAAARRFREIVRRATDEADTYGILISRGAAGLLAVAHAFGEQNESAVVIEAIEEPTSIAGVPSHELDYRGIEPWIVLLADLTNQERHIVVVSSDGSIRGHLSVPMEESELPYYPLRP